MSRSATALSLILSLLLCSSHNVSADVSLLEHDWIEVSTNNFIIYSSLNEEKTVELAKALEDFRRVFSIIANTRLPDDKVKTYIYLFREANPEIGLEWNYGGIFKPLMRGNYVVTRNLGSRLNLQVMQHEYTHYLMHNTNSLEYPTWYDEGFAELLSTIKAKGQKVEIGKPHDGRRKWLEHAAWLPFEELINVTDISDLSRNDQIMFYGQAWLLVHYLNFGREGHNAVAETARYLKLREAGKEVNEAFEQAYSENLEKLDFKLETYFDKKMDYYLLTLDGPFPESSIKIKKMEKDIISAKLGFLCLINDETGCAAEFYRESLELNPDNAASLVGLAEIHKLAGRFDKAEPLYQRAIKLEPEQPLHYLDFGEYFHERANKAGDPGQRKRWLGRAREYYERSIELDPFNPEALVMYGKTFLTDHADKGDLIKGVVKLSTAHRYMPANPEIKLMLAEGYARMGREDDARQLAERVRGWSHVSAADAAAEFLDELNRSDANN